jgi:hypothetical protein
LPEWPKGAVCKTVGSAYVGSNPTPATTCEKARLLRKRGPAGRFLLVTPCVSMSHRGSPRSSGYGHIADSVRAKLAVRITARFTVRRQPTYGEDADRMHAPNLVVAWFADAV